MWSNELESDIHSNWVPGGLGGWGGQAKRLRAGAGEKLPTPVSLQYCRRGRGKGTQEPRGRYKYGGGTRRRFCAGPITPWPVRFPALGYDQLLWRELHVMPSHGHGMWRRA